MDPALVSGTRAPQGVTALKKVIRLAWTRFEERLVFDKSSKDDASANGVVNVAKAVVDGVVNMQGAKLKGSPAFIGCRRSQSEERIPKPEVCGSRNGVRARFRSVEHI